MKRYLAHLVRALLGRTDRPIIINLTGYALDPETSRYATEEEIYDVRTEIPVRSLVALYREHEWQIDTGRGLGFPDEWDIVAQACDLYDSVKDYDGSAYDERSRLLIHKEEGSTGAHLYLYIGDVHRADDADDETLTTAAFDADEEEDDE